MGNWCIGRISDVPRVTKEVWSGRGDWTNGSWLALSAVDQPVADVWSTCSTFKIVPLNLYGKSAHTIDAVSSRRAGNNCLQDFFLNWEFQATWLGRSMLTFAQQHIIESNNLATYLVLHHPVLTPWIAWHPEGAQKHVGPLLNFT